MTKAEKRRLKKGPKIVFRQIVNDADVTMGMRYDRAMAAGVPGDTGGFMYVDGQAVDISTVRESIIPTKSVS
jgi:hypothetical protein